MDNNGGSDLEELNVTFLEYSNGAVKTFYKSNNYLNFLEYYFTIKLIINIILIAYRIDNNINFISDKLDLKR